MVLIYSDGSSESLAAKFGDTDHDIVVCDDILLTPGVFIDLLFGKHLSGWAMKSSMILYSTLVSSMGLPSFFSRQVSGGPESDPAP